jgi:hypothetical protein
MPMGSNNINSYGNDILIKGSMAYILTDVDELVIQQVAPVYFSATSPHDDATYYLQPNDLGDDMGNHTASSNLQLSTNYLSNDGDDEGISIDDDGKVTFSNNVLLNGSLMIDSAYTFPIVDGTNEQVLTTDGNGSVAWTDNLSYQSLTFVNDTLTISNGNSIAFSRGFISENGLTYSNNNNDDFLFGADALAYTSTGNAIEYKMFFDKSKGAFRAGGITGNEWDNNNIGDYSFAVGLSAKAKASYSSAFGTSTASGSYSSAFGDSNAGDLYDAAFGQSTASGSWSSAFGESTASQDFSSAFGSSDASGSCSSAFGISKAFSFAEVALGLFNTNYTPNSTSSFDSDDRLFVLGNGTNNYNRSDAMIVYKSGDTEINGDLTTTGQLTLGNNISLDGNYLSNDGNNEGINIDDDGNITMSGKLTTGGNILLNGNYLSNDGGNEGISIDDGGKVTFSSDILLNGNYLSNDGGGEGIRIDDSGNVTMSGELTTGGNILLNGNYLSNDGGNEGISIGNGGKVTTSGDLTTGGNIELDGNYLSNDGNNEGINIDDDGNITMSGKLTTGGDVSVTGTLTIEKSISGNNNYVTTIKNTNNDNTVRNDGLSIVAGHDNFNSNNSYLIEFSSPNGTTIGRIQQNSSGVAYKSTSDIRLKTNIQPTQYSLTDILNIEVRDYYYKTDISKTLQTGFLAQQLYEVFPMAVTKGGEDAKTAPWMVDYSKMTPLLVKGIQEQQTQIEALNLLVHQARIENEQLKGEVSKIQQLEHLSRNLVEQNAELKQQNTEMKAMLEQIQAQLNTPISE